jgi:hypothetical protein
MAGEEPEKPDEKPKQAEQPKQAPDENSAEASLRSLARATRAFLFPFLFSWALAYVGSARGVDWLYFAGLGGVTLSMLGFLVWLIG